MVSQTVVLGRVCRPMPPTDGFDPLLITWLRDAHDRLFHAVPVDELPPQMDPPGPIALCGRLVLPTSLFDDPAGTACRACLRRLSPPT